MPGIAKHHYHNILAGKFYNLDIIPCHDDDCDRDHKYVGSVNDYTSTLAAIFDNAAAGGEGIEYNGRVYYVTVEYDHRGSSGTASTGE